MKKDQINKFLTKKELKELKQAEKKLLEIKKQLIDVQESLKKNDDAPIIFKGENDR